MSLFERTELLIGSDGINKLRNAKVIIFGVGGVGGYIVEALVRAGIGAIDVVDNDTISETNLNRQIIALKTNIGKPKVEVIAERISAINENCIVTPHNVFVTANNITDFHLKKYDYVVDAIDNITAKIALAVFCDSNNIPIISSMGTGNKINPKLFKVSDIYKTNVCPLAKVMRYELKKRNVKKLKVVYSEEKPITNHRPPGSVSFVPGCAGLIIAGEVINNILKNKE